MTITPKQAQEWLNKKGYNRNLSKSHVTYLANEIINGNWKLTHQGIAFDEQGRLIDGQHRLQAIINANIPIKMMVTTDEPVDKFAIIDRGMPRTISFITGIPPSYTQIYTCILELTFLNKAKPSPKTINLMNLYLKPSVETLLKSSNTMIRFYSSAPIRTAAVISLEAGLNRKYILDTYTNLVLQKIDKLPMVAQALIRVHSRESEEYTSGNGFSSRLKNYCRAMYMFNEINQSAKNIQLKEDLKESYLKQARDLTSLILEKQIDNTKEIELHKIIQQKERELSQIKKKVLMAQARAINEENYKLSLDAIN